MTPSKPLFELLIPRRPLSHQAKNRQHLQDWKDFVYGRARQKWQGPPLTTAQVRLTLVYLCDDYPADIDNIIKPIQDALVGVILADDFQVTDVDSHRRFLGELDITKFPPLLLAGVSSNQECVYIRITASGPLEDDL